MNQVKHILIDGDILVYQSAYSVEKEFDFGDDLWGVAADLKEAKQALDNRVEEIVVSLEDLGYKGPVSLCLTEGRCYRNDIDPGYKANRRSRKPMVLSALRDHAKSLPTARWAPGLEADDIMGVLATGAPPGIICTIDKDLKGVPGLHYNFNKVATDPTNTFKVVEITDEQATQWHLIQSIAGDHTDGYGGCPGMGPKKAQAWLEKYGYSWESVVSAYVKCGLTEYDAIVTARLAKILTKGWCEYPAIFPKAILWVPYKGYVAPAKPETF